MDYLNFDGKIIYRDGWFLYICYDEVSPLTRDDARMIEYSYSLYQSYLCTNRAGSAWEGTLPFREYGFSRPRGYGYKFKVDELADASLDVKIGDVLEIPERIGEYTVTSICDYSFQFLNIRKLVLPKSIEVINKHAFSDCNELREISMRDGVPILLDAFSRCRYLKPVNGLFCIGNTLVSADRDTGGHIVIPDNIVCISPEAFRFGCKNVTSVKFPRGLKCVGQKAFQACDNLTSVYFADGASDLVIEDSAFEKCNNLSNVRLPEGLRKICHWAFCRCGSLLDIRIPSTVDCIEQDAFAASGVYERAMQSQEDSVYIDNWLILIKDISIEKLVIKEGTVGVAQRAFGFVRKNTVKSIRLASSVKCLNDNAFSGCAEEIIDLANVEYIGKGAIGWGHFETLHVPATCRFFGDYNFCRNFDLKDVYFHNPDTEVGKLINDSRDCGTVRVHCHKDSAVYLEVVTSPYDGRLQYAAIED